MLTLRLLDNRICIFTNFQLCMAKLKMSYSIHRLSIQIDTKSQLKNIRSISIDAAWLLDTLEYKTLKDFQLSRRH